MGRSQSIPRAGAPDGADGDDSGSPILHVDMDAFYVSVELRTRPELRGRPVIVGGRGGRGVVLSASYEARKFGVRSALPMARALRLCPHAVVIPPRMAGYGEVSRHVMGIFHDVTPLVEPLSLDEAFLDVAGARRLLGRPAAIGELIRARVHDEQGITCSVGVAPNKFLAKLASTSSKPDGLRVVPADRVLEFLHPLPLAALWGVGERTEAALRRLGLTTVGDIARTPVDTLRRAVGVANGTHLYELAWGRDPRVVTPDERDKSVGAEETFEVDRTDPADLHRELLRLSERTASRLRAVQLAGRTVSIKVRFADFTTLTRARTLPAASDVAQEIYAAARALYDALGLERTPVRLIGVRVEKLVRVDRASRQLAFGERERGWREAEQAIDQVANRFGRRMVRPATLVNGDDPAPRSPRDARVNPPSPD
ncbi:MAG: DNA polymerase IV [Mycobacteriales bacterium]